MGEFVNLILEALGPAGQAAEHSVGEFHRRQAQQDKKACDHADAGDQLILKEEFHALYNTDQPDASDEDIAFVDKLYARIKECDLQTFPYKF